MAERYELVGIMTWEQAKAVAEVLGGGSCVWAWHNGKKSCYPRGSLEMHSVPAIGYESDAKVNDA